MKHTSVLLVLASIYQLNVAFRVMHIYISGEIKFYRSVLVLLSNNSNNNL